MSKFLNLEGDLINTVLVTSDGKRCIINTKNTSFEITAFTDPNRYKIENVLIIDQLPDIGSNFRKNDSFKNYDIA